MKVAGVIVATAAATVVGVALVVAYYLDVFEPEHA